MATKSGLDCNGEESQKRPVQWVCSGRDIQLVLPPGDIYAHILKRTIPGCQAQKLGCVEVSEQI